MSNIECFIHHHLGLGDHIICNGLVRYIIKKYDVKNMCVVAKYSNINNVKRMFEDVPEVQFLAINEDKEFLDFYKTQGNTPLFRVGFEKCRNQEFDRSFYESVGVPFQARWEYWDFQRNYEQENLLIEELDITEDYIFVHDVSSVGTYDLNIDSDLRQIKLSRLKSEKSIFDWLGIIERAKEVHCINSSMIHLINSYNFNNKKFYHTIKETLRRENMGFTLQNDWRFVNYD